jgi:hypothetical protein
LLALAPGVAKPEKRRAKSEKHPIVSVTGLSAQARSFPKAQNTKTGALLTTLRLAANLKRTAIFLLAYI